MSTKYCRMVVWIEFENYSLPRFELKDNYGLVPGSTFRVQGLAPRLAGFRHHLWLRRDTSVFAIRFTTGHIDPIGKAWISKYQALQILNIVFKKK